MDDPDRTQRAVADHARAVLVGDVSTPPCQQIVSGTDGLVTCYINAPSQYITTTVASLSDILTQIQTSSCADCASVTADTPLWLQAWGAPGGSRAAGSRGGYGGQPGFAQSVTSINDLRAQGIIDLYYYFGQTGGYVNTSGASGGASTLVATVDLQRNPGNPPTSSELLLIAGGGGGSGGFDSGCVVTSASVSPGDGGHGGVAISTVGTDGEGIGQGGDASWRGSRGGEGVGGSSDPGNGGDGNGGIGGTGGPGSAGAGGGSGAGTKTWFNTRSTPLTFSDGGGGSWSAPSTCDDVTAPTTYPGNNSTSHANLFLVFNTQGTCQ